MTELIIVAIISAVGSASVVIIGNWGAKRLGIPTDVESRMLGSLKSLNEALTAEAAARRTAEQECRLELAEQAATVAQLEVKLDDATVQIARLMRLLGNQHVEPPLL